MAIDPEISRMFIDGFTFVQAVDVIHGRRAERTITPVFTRRHEPVYAIPGGGRATESEIRARLRGAS